MNDALPTDAGNPDMLGHRSPPTTGDPGVDQAVDLVARAAGQPLEVLLGHLETAHQHLQERLADVEG